MGYQARTRAFPHLATAQHGAVEPAHQQTLRAEIPCRGVGVHSGAAVTLTLAPAAPNTGIRFIRTDRPAAEATIPALWDRVVDTRLCTVLANDAGTRIGTVEHLLAALYAAGIDNAELRIDGPEVPILDGSSEPFLFLIGCVGVLPQAAPRRALEVLAPVHVTDGAAAASLLPGGPLTLSAAIDFPTAVIGRQSLDSAADGASFARELAAARTFGFAHEVEALRAAGLARGGSLDNAVVIDGDAVLNPGGLRWGDECIRHKLLDAVGDLALCGARLFAHYQAERPGHALNNTLLRQLFATDAAWRVTTVDAIAPTDATLRISA